jgi:hypothetical protein
MPSKSNLPGLFLSLTEGLSWTTNHIGMWEQVHNTPEIAKVGRDGRELPQEEYNFTGFLRTPV